MPKRQKQPVRCFWSEVSHPEKVNALISGQLFGGYWEMCLWKARVRGGAENGPTWDPPRSQAQCPRDIGVGGRSACADSPSVAASPPLWTAVLVFCFKNPRPPIKYVH